MENTSLVPRRFRLGWENTFNSQKHGKILSTYVENTLYCSDVYNLAQKLNNSDQIVMRLLVTHGGGKLSRIGDFSLAERLQGR